MGCEKRRFRKGGRGILDVLVIPGTSNLFFTCFDYFGRQWSTGSILMYIEFKAE